MRPSWWSILPRFPLFHVGSLLFHPALPQFLERPPGHDALVALGANPACVPVGQSRQLLAFAAVVRGTRLPVPLAECHLLRSFLGDHFLDLGKMGVIVVADRTHGQTPRAIAERANNPQEALPEAEEVTRSEGLHLVLLR